MLDDQTSLLKQEYYSPYSNYQNYNPGFRSKTQNSRVYGNSFYDFWIIILLFSNFCNKINFIEYKNFQHLVIYINDFNNKNQ